MELPLKSSQYSRPSCRGHCSETRPLTLSYGVQCDCRHIWMLVSQITLYSCSGLRIVMYHTKSGFCTRDEHESLVDGRSQEVS